jgi:hypothetical protein
MFEHVGFKPLWPVVFFLPWLLLGLALMVESVRHQRFRVSALRISLSPRSGRREHGDHRRPSGPLQR